MNTCHTKQYIHSRVVSAGLRPLIHCCTSGSVISICQLQSIQQLLLLLLLLLLELAF
jgi:hypothetical protein